MQQQRNLQVAKVEPGSLVSAVVIEEDLAINLTSMIECKNITKIYKNGDVETMALKGITFRIEKGEFVAIIGPSGSGKSTLMHILGALDNPSSGHYILNGKDVSKF